MRRFTFVIVSLIGCVACSSRALAVGTLAELSEASAIAQGQQARNARAVTGAADGAGDGAAATASTGGESVGLGGVKYIPAYAIALMLVGLSTFVVCRPSRRHSAD